LLKELNERLAEKGFQLEASDELVHWLVQEGYDPIYGARPMRRCVQKKIEDLLSEDILKGRFKDCKRISAILKDGAPAFVELEEMAEV
ncbi:MAG: ATP-dependent Clp protease ATP-binding subunit ClpC, partial [Nitrospirota bacterium]|nr:ATP-dependent Clp protease ATP-binding subunit ClpC [Nitrospirota bacterium]